MFRTFWLLQAGRAVGVVGLYKATAYDIQVTRADVLERVTRLLKDHNFDLTLALLNDLRKQGLAMQELRLKPGQTISTVFDGLRSRHQTGD